MIRLEKRKKKRWQEEDCSDCLFKIKYKCRRFPPVLEGGRAGTTHYPKVWIDDLGNTGFYWQNACAEYKKER